MSAARPDSIPGNLPGTIPASWLVPEWPSPPGVHALCTSREGGVSTAPWGSLNLGDHVGDDPQAVRTNRQRLQEIVRAHTPGACAVFLQQVHGVDVVALDAGSVQGQAFDACVTSASGVVCTIMVADCLPVLLAHRSGAVVGAAHAGWRGLAGGVLETLFERFAGQIQAPPGQAAQQTLAWLGPCIGPRSFEVGAEVRAAFIAHDAAAGAHFTAVPQEGGGAPKYLANLAGLARQRLAALGITAIYGNDGGDAWCTVLNGSRFFSHRRDAARLGSSGRFAACIWKD
ncbi:Multi-copper polyphenol oxidoreductase, laccase [Delftia sp. Cs1-4]|uniref:peptidoglycan editing factor PgeF n=1 Tax=Delftia sp. (strain Cs1-4) TaxID=742013 RepID=UPI00020E8227|nr:peptidoglycan editing factor PgeF [Delftia sp. Cs1-4]AEF90202.1 Multi-copper polyphenol oxidoreductase, laccase [Delftia sp. Cs1-4]